MSMFHPVELTNFNIVLSLLQIFSITCERTKAMQIQLSLFFIFHDVVILFLNLKGSHNHGCYVYSSQTCVVFKLDIMYLSYNIIFCIYITPHFVGFIPHYIFQRFSHTHTCHVNSFIFNCCIIIYYIIYTNLIRSYCMY